jgi:hypothetical protein
MRIIWYRNIQILVGIVFCLVVFPALASAQTDDVEDVVDKGVEESKSETEPKSEPELDSKRETIGWAEKVSIHPGGVEMQAKFVPGDESSSIHATRIKKFSRNGRDWVRFVLRDIRGENSTLEREVLRSVTIRGKKGSKERYLVHLGVCIGNEYGEAELRLANRAHRDFKILLGRNILAGKFLLDPSRSYVSKPKCPASDFKSVHHYKKKSEKKSKKKTPQKPVSKGAASKQGDKVEVPDASPVSDNS